MMLVVIYHTPPRFDTAHEVALFNMGAPVFFFAAGYLFNIDRFKNFAHFIKHRARQLLVPYVTFFIVFYALWLIVGRRMAGPEEQAISIYKPLWDLVTGQPSTVLGPFWFLACLFTMQLIYYPLRRCLHGAWPLLASTLLCFSLFILPDEPWVRYWNLDRALLYMPIYATGDCLKHWFEQLRARSLLQTLLWATLALIGMAFLIIAPHTIDRGIAYVLTPFAVISTLPAITCICKGIQQRYGESHVARNVAITSITWLAVQNYIIGIIKIVATRVMGTGILDDNILFKVVIALAVMAVIYPLALMVERFMPWMLGKGKLFNN